MGGGTEEGRAKPGGRPGMLSGGSEKPEAGANGPGAGIGGAAGTEMPGDCSGTAGAAPDGAEVAAGAGAGTGTGAAGAWATGICWCSGTLYLSRMWSAGRWRHQNLVV